MSVQSGMPDQDDDDLFRKAMGDVKPLSSKPRHDQMRPPNGDIPSSTLKKRREAAISGKTEGGAALSEAWVEPIEPEQKIEFSRSGIQQSRLRQLRHGNFNVQYQVDLHGYKIDEARELVFEFLQFAQSQGHICVRIIHGKSHRIANRQSTLKSHVNHWLRQLPEVLAFTTAPPSEGGAGSLLVLLKKKHSSHRTENN